MSDNLLVLAGETGILQFDVGEDVSLLVVRDTAPVVTLVENHVGMLVAPAGQGPTGAVGRDGATCDLAVTTTRALSGHMAVCTAADGTLAYASADDPATAATFIGITLDAAAPGASIAVRFTGAVVEPSWSWTPGPVFVGLHGALTQADPVAGYALAVGVATAPDTLLVARQPFVFIA